MEDLAPAFVLGALNADEMAAVRSHLAACPETHARLADLGSAVPALLESVEIVEPPAELRGRILATARDQRRLPLPPGSMTERGPEVRLQVPAAQQPGATVTRGGRWLGVVPRRPAWIAVGLAAAFAIVALGSWNLQLRSQVDELRAYREGVLQVLDQAARPGGQLAVLAAPDGAARASGIAAIGSDGSVAVAMRDLAPTSGTQAYEVWLIGPDGAPVPIGGFAVGGGGTASFATRAGPSATGIVVALTLEPGPGATSPTLPLVALGTAQPPPD